MRNEYVPWARAEKEKFQLAHIFCAREFIL